MDDPRKYLLVAPTPRPTPERRNARRPPASSAQPGAPASPGPGPGADARAALKLLARDGAGEGFVRTSSGALAERLQVSQQTASRKILELVDQGLLERRMGARGQHLRITPSGLALLRRELEELKAILEAPARGPGEEEWMEVRGTVAAGLGEGGWYMARAGYREPMARLLGFAPYPGTLNLALAGEEVAKLERLRAREGHVVAGFEDEGRSFGAVKCFRARIGDIGEPAGVVLPYRGHHRDALEVVAAEYLRGALGLEDGDEVRLHVALVGAASSSSG